MEATNADLRVSLDQTCWQLIKLYVCNLYDANRQVVVSKAWIHSNSIYCHYYKNPNER